MNPSKLPSEPKSGNPRVTAQLKMVASSPLLMGLRHFLAPKGAENLSAQGKEVDDLKTPETLVNTRFMHIRAESTSLSGFEAIFGSVFV
jgi:hypothetical protein